MIQGIVFDLDDTLYRQIQPFETAFRKSFPATSAKLDISEAFHTFRKHSDAVFTKQTSGEWTLEFMRQYRIKETLFELADLTLTTAEADYFQENYLIAQSHIKLEPEIIQLLTHLTEEKIPLALITNGPDSHQAQKIEQLQLRRWFKPEHLIVSGQVGTEKPGSQIFNIAADALGLASEALLYVGDSFPNDVIGAKTAHWQSLWFNHQGHPTPQSYIQPDWIVDSYNALPIFIQTLLK